MPPLALGFTPNIQQLVYNGHAFNDSKKMEAFSVRPVESACGRTFAYAEFFLTVSEKIQPSSRGKNEVDEAVSVLTQKGAGLLLVGHGFGPLNINLRGPQDVRWGPTPTECVVENLGAGNLVRLRWSCKFATMTCGDAVTAGAFALEFCYRVSYAIEKGYTKRTVSGFVAVPATRFNADDRRLPITADVMREKINPPLLPGFDRRPGTFEFDYAKTRCDFAIVDEQFKGAAPPPGVIACSAEETIAQEPNKHYTWTATLSASYEIAAPLPTPAVPVLPIGGAGGGIGAAIAGGASLAAAANAGVKRAVDAFFALLADRMERVKRQILPEGKKALALPWQFSVGDPAIYGPTTVRLTATYRIYSSGLKEILGSSGMWAPVPGADWNRWAASVATHLSPRGVVGLVLSTSDDKIVDLCRPDKPTTVTDLGGRRGPGLTTIDLRGGPLPRDADLTSKVKAAFPTPTPDASYIDYQCGYRIESDDGVVVASTLPSEPLTERSQSSGAQDALNDFLPRGRESSFYPPATDVIASGQSQSPVAPVQDSGGGTFTQRRTLPRVFVFLFGYAVRIAYPIAVPELLSLGGSPVTACNRLDRGEGFEQTQIGGDALGRPLYVAKWNIRYAVTDPPAGPMPVPPNPLVGGTI